LATSWAANPESVTIQLRAAHLMTSGGKAVVAKYYGHPQTRAYFQGFSTGGARDWMEVQKFPGTIQRRHRRRSGLQPAHANQRADAHEAFAAPRRRAERDADDSLHEAALAACDAQDGVKDGIVTDPRACGFDPVVLQCKEGHQHMMLHRPRWPRFARCTPAKDG